jgi:tetratricopeptide (TPR) repeat protein
MGGGGGLAHVLTIAVRAQGEHGLVAVTEEELPGTALPVRGEGPLVIDAAALRACATPREYGLRLGEALFVGATLAAWQRARARGRERLHVVLAIEAAELRGLRWERLCAPFGERWDFVRCDQRTPFTLHVASDSDREYPPPPPGEAPRVLLLVTSPGDLADYGLTAFDTLATIYGLRTALAPWPVDVLAFGVPDAVGPPTLEGLCAQLTVRRYSVVHMVCHGAVVASSGETVLYLADEDESTAATPASKLLRRLARLGGEVGLPRLWFLGACASAAPEAEGALGGLAMRLGRELGAPAVVAMSDRVSIATADALCRPFYRQLRAHGLVDLALAEACSQVAERADVVVPVLHARSAGEPLFPADTSGQVVKDMSSAPDPIVFSESPLPLALGERFVGRTDVIAALRRRFEATGRPVAVALVAAGGLGKTRVALELVWQQRGLFPGGVFWLDVSAPARREAGHAALLRQLRPDIPLAALQEQGVAARLAEAARAHRPGQAQLWVLDHLPEPEPGQELPAFTELCPRWGEVAVLITSRVRPADPELPVIELEALDDAAGVALLTAGLPPGGMALADATAVVRWVGGLPIALELLARSLDLGDLSATELRALVGAGGVVQALDETQQVLREAGAAGGLSPIVESLRISYTRLSPAAQALARRLAQFGPEPLPTTLVKALGAPASRLARATLAARSFVTGISGECFGAMHRVLADFLRGLCGAEEPADACAALLAAMPQAELGDPLRWPLLSALAVHAEALLFRSGAGVPGILELGLRLGLLYHQQQRGAECEPVRRYTLALAETSLPSGHRLRLAAAADLGLSLCSLGALNEARALQAETLQRCEAALGGEDLLTLGVRSNLAVTLQLLGEVVQARAELQVVAEHIERSKGPDDPATLNAWLSLAGAELGVGRAAVARALQERVLAGWRKMGPAGEASAVATAGYLAQTLQMQGELPAARATVGAAFESAQRLWGPDNPTTLRLRVALATILRDLGEVVAAQAEMQAALALLRRVLGPAHPQALTAQYVLADLLIAAERYAEARALLEEALALGLPRFGPGHPLMLGVLGRLVDVLQVFDELPRARALLEQTFAQLGPVPGVERPELLRLQQSLADLLGQLGELTAARELQARVLATWEAAVGPRHPLALAAAASLALIDTRSGALAQARALQERVLKDSRDVRGANDPETLTVARQLAATLYMQGELAAARALQAELVAGLTQTLGATHMETLLARAELGGTLRELGLLAEAEAELLPAIAGFTGQLPADHRIMIDLRSSEARLRIAQGRLAEARDLLVTLLPLAQRKLGPHSVAVGYLGMTLGRALHDANAFAEAVPLLQDSLAILEQLLPADADTVACAMLLATAIVKARGEPAVARAALTRASERVRQVAGEHSPLLPTIAALVASLGLVGD